MTLGLASFWHWVVAWWPIMRAYDAAALWVIGLVAAAILIPRINFTARAILLGAAALVALLTAAFTVGIKLGGDRVTDEWRYQLGQEADSGEQIRKDADHAVSVEPDSVRNASPWNRDNWKHRTGR